VTTFVAVEGGGILRDGIERLGALPDEKRNNIYPIDKSMTKPISKYGEAMAEVAEFAQFIFLYSL
jgi:hypothetical protein